MVCIVCTSGDCFITFVLLDFVGVNFNTENAQRGAIIREGRF